MREIRFRGKIKDKWCVGSLLVDWAGTCQIWEKDNDNALHNFIVDEKTVGQYIGLKDKGGLSIYEGDIIEKFCNNRHTGGEIKRYEVVYDGESFCLKRNDALFGFGNRDGKILKKEKVIGNIYDNPELLSGSEV